MITRPLDWLIATAAIPLLAAIGVSLALWSNRRRWSLILARLGVAGGACCAIILAVLLNGASSETSSVQMMFGEWFSFSSPNSVSIKFGLEADFIKCCLFALIGVVVLIGLLRAKTVGGTFSDDLILTNSLLYSTTAFFVFAPNLAQSLLGWGAISLLATLIIRLSQQRSESISPEEKSAPLRSPFFRQIEQPNGWGQGMLPTIISMVRFLERAFQTLGQWLFKTLPNGLCDQAEPVVESPVNVQLLAAILGTSAILLTWLFMPFG